MKNYLEKVIVAPPVQKFYPIQRLIETGWGRVILAVVFLGAGYLAWTVNLIVHSDWVQIIAPVYKLAFTGAPSFISIDLRGAGYALLALLELFVTGALVAEIFLPQESDRWLKRLASLLFGFGFIGTITTLLAAFFQLHLLTLCVTLLLMLLGLIALNVVPEMKRGSSIRTKAREMISLWKIGKDDFPDNSKKPLFIFCLVLFGIMEYQALRLIEIDWDALIYHANLAKIMFDYGGMPVIAGPSAGLELSANYPPLFSALGAYFYVIASQFNDTYLRMLGPIFSLLTLMAVYKIGSELGDNRYGTIAVILLCLTPLYFSRSIYATNYLPATAFLSAALLFFIKGYPVQRARYWPISGLMFGFALLTSYHALVFIPSILILTFLVYHWADNHEHKNILYAFLVALSLALGIYGVWLIRNTIYVHNPIYPFGSQWIGGLHFDAAMFNRTTSAIRLDSIYNYFGTYTPSLDVYLQHLFINRSQFPVISILLVLGALLIPFDPNRRGWALVGLFALPVGLLFASTLINIFPRYFVLILPECALIVALFFVRTLAWANFHFVVTTAAGLQKYRSLNTTMHALTGILVGLMFVFPGNLAVILGKQYGEADIYQPNYWKSVPAAQDVYGTLEIVYGKGVRAWEWLKPRTKNTNSRIASYENRTYYLTDNINTMFYLDGWEAKSLYKMTEPGKAFAFLQAHQVKYILDPYWIKNWSLYKLLPLNRFLGDPEYFPLIYDTPDAKIYQVGRVEDILTDHSPLTINLSQAGWSPPERSQGEWSRSIAKNTTQARIFVSYASQMILKVEYLDSGTGTVDFNVKKPDGTWDYSTHIVLTNSNQWKTQKLKLPSISKTEIVEIGIFSQSNDFFVRHISASGS